MNHMNQLPPSRTATEIVESTLQSNLTRLAGSYRAADLPRLSRVFSKRLRPILRLLNPVVCDSSLEFAQHVVDRALVSINVLSENDDLQLKAMKALSGSQIRRLMRINNVTIEQLAKRMQITRMRVRQVRDNGVEGNCFCRDWYEAITGTGVFSLH